MTIIKKLKEEQNSLLQVLTACAVFALLALAIIARL